MLQGRSGSSCPDLPTIAVWPLVSANMKFGRRPSVLATWSRYLLPCQPSKQNIHNKQNVCFWLLRLFCFLERRVLAIALEQIQMLSPINRVATRGRCSCIVRRMWGRRPALLAEAEAEQTRSLDRLAENTADTYDRLGAIALTRPLLLACGLESEARAFTLLHGPPHHPVEVALDPFIVNRDDIVQRTRCIV
jgi:hypothetical protein